MRDFGRDVFAFMCGLFFGLAFATATGCAGGPEQAARVAVAVVGAFPVIDAQGLAAYERELAACPDEACAARVEAQWAPYISIMLHLREVICEADPKKAGCSK